MPLQRDTDPSPTPDERQPDQPGELRRTPLHDLHLRLGAKMVPFAGYAMPLQYPTGLLKEHLHTRAAAGLFDVSHMGQITVRGRLGHPRLHTEEARRAVSKHGPRESTFDACFDTPGLRAPHDEGAKSDLTCVGRCLETLLPIDVLGLKPGRQRYGLFTTETGGILDDLMLANLGTRYMLVVNASRKSADEAHLRAHLLSCEIAVEQRALLALQGPQAEAALATVAPSAAAMRFMDVIETEVLGAPAVIARSGYTGEDGFEISVPADRAEAVAEALLTVDGVLPIGLGARDSLRLEACLCLYGSDMDEGTTPVEAALEWTIPPVRRPGGTREGGFLGAALILQQLTQGAPRRRVALRPEGRTPVRAGAPLFGHEQSTEPVGSVTSGGFGPAVGAPVAMGFVRTDLAEPGRRLFAEVRGRRLPVAVARGPFVPARFKRS